MCGQNVIFFCCVRTGRSHILTTFLKGAWIVQLDLRRCAFSAVLGFFVFKLPVVFAVLFVVVPLALGLLCKKKNIHTYIKHKI